MLDGVLVRGADGVVVVDVVEPDHGMDGGMVVRVLRVRGGGEVGRDKPKLHSRDGILLPTSQVCGPSCSVVKTEDIGKECSGLLVSKPHAEGRSASRYSALDVNGNQDGETLSVIPDLGEYGC